MIFRSKPKRVEAMQFWETEPLPFSPRPVVCYVNGRWYVETIHGQHAYLDNGDWVILEPGSRHQAYPCKPDIFADKYEPANRQPAWIEELEERLQYVENLILAPDKVPDADSGKQVAVNILRTWLVNQSWMTP